MNGKNDKIEYFEEAIVIEKRILVIGDLHLGYESRFAGREGYIDSHLESIKDKLKRIFNKFNNKSIEKIIILGDLKHDFGKISETEWRDIVDLIKYLKDKGEVIVVKGNHDNILKQLLEKQNIELLDYYKIKHYFFIHGDNIRIFNKCLSKICNINYIILGHLHPAIILSDKYKSEKYKCYLVGKINNKKVVVLPSFSEVFLGYSLNDINSNDKNKKEFFVIPDKDLLKFNVLIYNNKEEKIYDFGKLRKIK